VLSATSGWPLLQPSRGGSDVACARHVRCATVTLIINGSKRSHQRSQRAVLFLVTKIPDP